jgi:hypothetical protein
MGALRDAILAVLADGNLTDEEKRASIRSIKANGLRNNATFPFTFTVAPYTITAHDAQVMNGNLVAVLSATRSGVPVPLDNPFVFVNPPIMIPDTSNPEVEYDIEGRRTRGFSESPLQALRQIVVDAVDDAWRRSQ